MHIIIKERIQCVDNNWAHNRALCSIMWLPSKATAKDVMYT